MPTNFWARDLDQVSRPEFTSGVAPSFDPERAPDPEMFEPRCRPHNPHADLTNYDLIRDEQALNPFDEDIPGALRAEQLPSVVAATPPGADRHTNAETRGVPSPVVRAARSLPRGTDSGASSLQKLQPGRGHDQAA